MRCISSTEKAGIHIPFMNDVKSKFMVTEACYTIENCYVKATFIDIYHLGLKWYIGILYTFCTFGV